MPREDQASHQTLAERIGTITHNGSKLVAIDHVSLVKIRQILNRNGYDQLAQTYVPLSQRLPGQRRPA